MSTKYYIFIFLFTLTSLANVSGQSLFKESALAWGVEHYHRGIMGGGVAIFDYNNDGFLDLYLTGGLFRDELFRNNGNQTFTRVTATAGLAITDSHNTMAVVTGDLDNDGYSDIFVSTDKGQGGLLFKNNGDGTFLEVTSEAGISKNQWAMGATLGDFNLDGYLDLYIINYVQSHKSIVDDDGEVIGFDHICYPNNLYLNNGDFTFTEVSESSSTNNKGCGLAVAASDINNDNLPDIYIANDFGEWVKPNACFINNYPDNQFSEVATAVGVDAGIYGMGIAIGDYNRDGLLDYYVSNLGSNVLYKNLGNGNFSDEAADAGVLNTSVNDKLATSWGTAFFDYDHDGFEDLFVSNGYIPSANFIANAKDDPNKLYKNLGDGTFSDVSEAEGIADVKISRGLAVGDLDNDGDQDVVVAVIGTTDEAGNILIYENTNTSDNHWLKVMLQGVDANPDGYGAKVKAYDNGVVWVHEVDGGSSHVSQNSKAAHFGLGEAGQLDSLIVVWPGGKKQKFQTVGTNQTLLVTENEASYDIVGCMNQSADNYDAAATYNSGCFVPIQGCLDETSIYFDPEANIDNGQCTDVVSGLAQAEINLVVAPNPVKEKLVIKLASNNKEYQVQLINNSGSILYTANLIGELSIDRKDHWPSGIYFIKLISREEVIIRKVVMD